MFFYVDENGDVQTTDDPSVIPEYQQQFFPDVDFSEGEISDDNIEDSVSCSDSDTDSHIESVPSIDHDLLYDSLVDVLASAPQYQVFPNTSAVSVFQSALESIDSPIGYFVISGPDTYTTYLYYSDNYKVDGNHIYLYSPVTRCTYSQYRQTTSSAWQYTYVKSTVGDMDVNLSTSLVYTNLVDGYPDLIPQHNFSYYPLLFMIALSCVGIFVSKVSSIFKKGRKDND